MAITIIICVSVVVSMAILSFGSFCKEHPDVAARIFEREDDSDIVKIRLKWGEKKKYREFLFRHGYEGYEGTFAKDALFRAMQEYDLSSLDDRKESLEINPAAWRKFTVGAL